MEGAEEKKLSTLEFTQDQKKTLGPVEQQGMIKAFRNYDINNDGVMDEKEFKNIMIDLGYRKITDEKVAELLAEQDKNSDGVLQWVEFVDMMVGMQATDDGKFGQIVEGKGGAVAQIIGADGSMSSYSIEERTTFAKIINLILKDDEDCKDRIPMNTEDDSLFHVFDNGIMACKLLLHVDENCLDSRALNRMENMNVYQCKENLQMGIAAAKGVGVKLIGIDSNDFINKVPKNILAFVWQTVKMIVAKKITLKDTPEIMRLANEGEELKDLNKLKPEELLVRWINFHLKEAGQERRVTNLGKDLADSEALLYVLNRLDPSLCSLDGLAEQDQATKANIMINNSLAIGVPDIVTARDIVAANTKVNTLFVAYIFNTNHGLQELTKEEYEAAGMIDDDVEGTKEERTFRFFINALGIDGIYINDVLEDCRDGLVLAAVCDRVDATCVDWKKIDKNPNNDFKKNINNNAVVEACKNMGLKMIGIGGVDLTKGDKKLTLACVWQIVKQYYLHLVGDKKEADIIAWANASVAGKVPDIKDFKDKSLSDGKYMTHLCAAIEPRCVNWDLVLPGETDEDKQNNAKYAISCARKLGGVIFCVWEDLVQVNQKQNLIFFATMMDLQAKLKASQ